MEKTFTHTVSDSGEGHIPFTTDASSRQRIEMKVDANGNFWLSANREGYLHLARVFAEIALREFPSGFHFHKNANFRFRPEVPGPEFSFGLNDEA
jgi:hypothetical protein